MELVMAIVKNKIETLHDSGHKGVIVDGYPRREDEAILFERQIAEPIVVVLLQCAKDVAKQRFMSRSGREACEQSFEGRFQNWTTYKPGMVIRYGSKGLMKVVEADKDDVDGVYADLKAKVKTALMEAGEY